MTNLEEELRDLFTERAADMSQSAAWPDLRRIKRRRRGVIAAVVMIIAGVIAVGVALADEQNRSQEVNTVAPVQSETPTTFVGPNGQTFGPMPESQSGTVDPSVGPDFVSVVSPDDVHKVIGYVRREELLAPPTIGRDPSGQPVISSQPINVYDTTGATVIGTLSPITRTFQPADQPDP